MPPNPNKAATNAIFTLNRVGNGNGPLTVYFSTRGGTATAGTDYVAVNTENLPTSSLTPITWADGDLSPKTASVQILNSGSTSNKTFVVALDDGLAPRTAGSGIPPYSRAGVVILSTNTTPSPGILALTGYTNEVTSGFADTGAAFSVPATNGGVTLQVARTSGSSGPNVAQGVGVEVGETEAAIDLDIVVEYGVSIAELGRSIQRNVKQSVERMTGLRVVEVNIAVDDVYLPSDSDQGSGSGTSRVS